MKLVDELLTGPVLALEVTKQGARGEQVVTALRELVGPHDPVRRAARLYSHALWARDCAHSMNRNDCITT